MFSAIKGKITIVTVSTKILLTWLAFFSSAVTGARKLLGDAGPIFILGEFCLPVINRKVIF